MNQQNLIVFTDMDGSLLDHYTYSHQPADRLLASLEQMGIPVIANTSKTRAELEQLRQELNNTHPFIAENGAAIYLPKAVFPAQPEGTESQANYWVKAFSEPRAHWQSLIAELAPEFNNSFTTFAQAGVEGIVEMTGLAPENAERAAQREYGEPVKWLGSAEHKAAFFAQLETRGAQILHGGRFSHVSGQSDKGVALNWLATYYADQLNKGEPCVTVALGDSQNDVAMLDAADYAVIIKSPTHQAPSLHTQLDKAANNKVFRSSEPGPRGWVQGMEQVLKNLKIKNL